jgi:hypothetical protein
MTQIGFQTWVKPDLEKTTSKVTRSDNQGGRTGVWDNLYTTVRHFFLPIFQGNDCLLV